MTQKDTVLVLTWKGINSMVREGGCGYWRANAQSLSSCKYLVATRNSRRSEREGDEPHGAAFLVGEVSGVSQEGNRYIINLKRFALLDDPVPDVWTSGGSNPVHYEFFETLGIDRRKLKWQPWPLPGQTAAFGDNQPLTMTEAKRGLALTFGVEPEQVEITIKG
jgi:hypothetical protein